MSYDLTGGGAGPLPPSESAPALVGQVVHVARRLGTGLDSPGSIPGVGGLEILLHYFVSKLVLGSFARTQRVKFPSVGTSRPTSSYSALTVLYVDPCIHIPHVPSWPVMGDTFSLIYPCSTVGIESGPQRFMFCDCSNSLITNVLILMLTPLWSKW